MNRSNLKEVVDDIGAISSIMQSFIDKITKDDLDLFEKTATQGDSQSALLAGLFYCIGNQSISNNSSKAIKWLTFAAERNESFAMIILGVIYSGHPTSPFPGKYIDVEAAIHWLKKSQEEHSAAKVLLSELYLDQNRDEEAYDILVELHKEGDLEATKNLTRLIEFDLVKNKLNLPVNELLKTSADNGDVPSLYFLGYNYCCEHHSEKDIDKAIKYWKEGFQKGSAECAVCLGNLYLDGEDVELDAKKALEYFEIAAKQGEYSGLAFYGSSLFFGTGIPQDIEKGLDYLEKASAKGVLDAKITLFNIYDQGIQIAPDPKKAKKLNKEIMKYYLQKDNES